MFDQTGSCCVLHACPPKTDLQRVRASPFVKKTASLCAPCVQIWPKNPKANDRWEIHNHCGNYFWKLKLLLNLNHPKGLIYYEFKKLVVNYSSRTKIHEDIRQWQFNQVACLHMVEPQQWQPILFSWDSNLYRLVRLIWTQLIQSST